MKGEGSRGEGSRGEERRGEGKDIGVLFDLCLEARSLRFDHVYVLGKVCLFVCVCERERESECVCMCTTVAKTNRNCCFYF